MNIKSQSSKAIHKETNFTPTYQPIRQISSHNRKNYAGQKFGMLTALNFEGLIGKSRTLKSLWNFRCDCGNNTTKVIYDVVNGKTKSCGCLNHKRGKDAKHWKGYKDIPSTYFSSLKQGAATRNMEFKITIQYIWNLFVKQNKKCNLSGAELKFDTDNFKNTSSLDRIDSSKGYVKGNVQWVHKTINFMKQNMDDADFVNWCKIVSSHSA